MHLLKADATHALLGPLPARLHGPRYGRASVDGTWARGVCSAQMPRTQHALSGRSHGRAIQAAGAGASAVSRRIVRRTAAGGCAQTAVQ